jgi:hypothetical protein
MPWPTSEIFLIQTNTSKLINKASILIFPTVQYNYHLKKYGREPTDGLLIPRPRVARY